MSISKIDKTTLVADMCKANCALFGSCKGKVRPNTCLGYKDKTGVKKEPVIDDPSTEHQTDTFYNTSIKLYTFESRNAILKGNNSICDNCLHEIDGLCKLKQLVHLKLVKDCKEFEQRQYNGVVM